MLVDVFPQQLGELRGLANKASGGLAHRPETLQGSEVKVPFIKG